MIICSSRFHVDELLARVKALLRRSHVLAPQRLCTGGLVLDCDTNEVFCSGRRVELRPSEQRLLGLLIRRSGRLVSKEAIQAAIERIGSENSPNALEKLVSRLRRSLADCPAGINLRTVKGLGYVLEESSLGCCGSIFPREPTCRCTRSRSSTEWLGSSMNGHRAYRSSRRNPARDLLALAQRQCQS